MEGKPMADTKIFVPKQPVKRGVAGYRGKNVVVVDRRGKPEAAPEKKSK